MEFGVIVSAFFVFSKQMNGSCVVQYQISTRKGVFIKIIKIKEVTEP